MGRGAWKPQDQQPICCDMASQSRERSDLIPTPKPHRLYTPVQLKVWPRDSIRSWRQGGRGGQRKQEGVREGAAESAPAPPAAAFSALALP